MKRTLLEFLVCPSCSADFNLSETQTEANEILTGELSCRCTSSVPIRRGVPRFIDAATTFEQTTSRNFGAQWLEFDHVDQLHEGQFLDWIYPIKPNFVRGKTVLEGGCGKGRHTRLVASWGAHDVIGVDVSESVDVAFRNTRSLENAHIIQADINHLPLKRLFDYAFSVGVLHHLPDPRRGFLSLAERLRPGGSLSAWVYGRENNGWVVHLINPVRRNLTSKLPFRVLYYLSYFPALLLYAAAMLVYRPLSGTNLGRRLFYSDYVTYLSRFPMREIHNIVHDHLTAPIAHYISRPEFERWFRDAEAEGVEISWHNRNSWRGVGTIAARAEVRHAK